MTLNPTPQAVAVEMAAEAKRQGRRQKDVAAELGVTEQTVSRHLITGNMTLSQALALADAIGAELADLIERAPKAERAA